MMVSVEIVGTALCFVDVVFTGFLMLLLIVTTDCDLNTVNPIVCFVVAAEDTDLRSSLLL